jgi:hypothetical protein
MSICSKLVPRRQSFKCPRLPASCRHGFLGRHCQTSATRLRTVDQGQLDRGYRQTERKKKGQGEKLTKSTRQTGNKKDNVTIIYTPWSNLKKDGSMATGQVAFKDHKMVKRVHVAKRENPIINRLNKTKVESFPDFRQEKEDREKELRKKDRSLLAARVRRTVTFIASKRNH